MTRREFMGAATMAAGGVLMPKLAGARSFASAPFTWGCLLHLGSNMWDDFADDPDGWAMSVPDETVSRDGNHENAAVHGVDFTCRGLDLLAAARDRHYPKA